MNALLIVLTIAALFVVISLTTDYVDKLIE